MNEMRKKLIDRMSKMYGANGMVTIEFTKLCENYPEGEINDDMLAILVEAHEEVPYVTFGDVKIIKTNTHGI